MVSSDMAPLLRWDWELVGFIFGHSVRILPCMLAMHISNVESRLTTTDIYRVCYSTLQNLLIPRVIPLIRSASISKAGDSPPIG